MVKHLRWIAIVTAFGLAGAACGSDKKEGGAATTAGAGTTAGAATTAGATTTGAATTAGATTINPKDVKTDKGITDTEIKVALLNGFTGPVAPLAIPAAEGMEAYFQKVNDEGGVCGRKLVLERVDTKYDPQVAVQQYRAVKDNVAMLGGLVGTATIFGLSKDIERDNIATLANTGSEAVLPLPNVLMFIAPFALEVVNGVSWAADELKGDDGKLQLGVIYQADAFGESGLKAVEYVAANRDDVEIVGKATYAPTDQDLTAQVQAMKDSGAEVVWLHMISTQVAKLLGVAQQLNYKPTWLGISASYASSMAKPLGNLLDNLRYMSSFVSFGEDVPGMADFEANLKKVAPGSPGQDFTVTGYLNGSVAAALLKRACELGDMTQAGIAKAQVGLKVDNEGISSDFSYGATPDERIPTRTTRVNKPNLETTFGTPVTQFAVSPLGEKWTVADSK